MQAPENQNMGCGSGCQCSAGHGHDHKLPQEPGPGGLGGRRLVWAVIGAFLLPLALAVTGGIVAGGSTDRRVIGVLVGLGAGLLIAVIASRLVGGRKRNPYQASRSKNGDNGCQRTNR
jgi:hypothetical protein